MLKLKFKKCTYCTKATIKHSICFSNDRRSCHVRYQPTMEEQTYGSAFGLNGAYTVLYDVEATDMYGSMSVNNGYVECFN